MRTIARHFFQEGTEDCPDADRLEFVVSYHGEFFELYVGDKRLVLSKKDADDLWLFLKLHLGKKGRYTS